MFYGQNCSGRLGEKKTVISIVGSKDDYSFVRFLDEFELRKIKRELNRSHFNNALRLVKKYDIKVSVAIISSKQFGLLSSNLLNYSNWFSKLYGIICYKVLEPIIDRTIYLQMDREYDIKTQNIATETIQKLLLDIDIKTNSNDFYIRKEREYPSNKIMIADLFARGCFRGFDCSSIIANKKINIKNETEKIFKKTH